MPLRRFLVLVVVVTAGIVSLTIWYFPTTADFRSQNPFWNGLDEFRARYDVTPLLSLTELPQAPADTLLVIFPYQEPSAPELSGLQTYVETGGTVLLGNDWGVGNVILEFLGVSARFSGHILLDTLFNSGNRRLPIATDFTASPLTADVSSLALNYATIIEGIEGDAFTMIAGSSSFSFLDLNGDGTANDDEPVGPFVVVAQIPIGEGQLILLSDPSLIINSMLDAKDNAQFIDNLVDISGQDPSVFLDQAHLFPSRLDDSRALLGTIRAAASLPIPLTFFTVVVTVVALLPVWRRKGGPVWTNTS